MRSTRAIAKWVALGLLGVVVIGGGYCGYVAHEVTTRLAGRRWDVATRVYADVTTLYAGQRMSQALLETRPTRLGYRHVAAPPTQPGELWSQPRQVQVFLRDVAQPVLQRQGFAATIRFGRHGILAIERRDAGQSERTLELEPEELMQLFGSSHQSRRVVALGELPHYVVDAVLAAEDADFHRHHGVDPAGLVRALWVNLRSGEIRQGGSTITQQLAKSYFLSAERTLGRKLRELWVAVVLEWSYDKNEILETYLNEIYFGQRGSVSVRGVGEAAHFYFGRSAQRLTIAEAATLAGLIKAPNRYSPHAHPDRALQRRNQVLRAMHQQGWLDEHELAEAEQAPSTAIGFQPYQRQAPYFVDHVRAELQERHDDADLQRLGLSVYTTLDTDAQRAAERALRRGLERLERNSPALRREGAGERLQGAVVVMNVRTGHILAMVGGRDYGESQYNRITQARRQPGSTFKPFVFLAGLDTHSPAAPLSNEPQVYQVDGKRWAPRNHDGVTGGTVRMREALGKSINLATVDLAMRVGLDEVVATATRLGVSTPLKPQPSLALGAFEVVPLELARAYAAFAAGGVLPEPVAVRHVADEQGQPVAPHHPSARRATSAAEAFVLTSMLEEVVDGGTGAALRRWGVHIPVAGKTGTTTHSRDAWFVGYTPEVVALVWVGFDDGTSTRSSATRAALPIWAELAAAVPWLMSGDEFARPPAVSIAPLCEQSGHRAASGCPDTIQDYLIEGHPASKTCPDHEQWGVVQGVMHRLKNVFGF